VEEARHIDVYWVELSFGIDNGEIRLAKWRVSAAEDQLWIRARGAVRRNYVVVVRAAMSDATRVS